MVESLYEDVHRLCGEYVVDASSVDFSVAVSLADIEFERSRSTTDGECSFGYYETLAVYRKIAEELPYRGKMLFHGSCLAVDGVGYLFTAKSGAGKSTHAALWRELLGDKVVMINDDKPILEVADSGVVAYGTPWDGKHRLSTNTSVLLKSVCIIERASENSIVRLDFESAYPILIQQTYRPLDAGSLSCTLELVDRMKNSVDFWKLCCNKDISAAELSFNTMKG